MILSILCKRGAIARYLALRLADAQEILAAEEAARRQRLRTFFALGAALAVSLCLAGCQGTSAGASQLEAVTAITNAVVKTIPKPIEGACPCLKSWQTTPPAISLKPDKDAEAKSLLGQIYKRSEGDLEVVVTWHPKCPPECKDETTSP